ncbi:MAG: Franean1_4349 family RiPP [Erysipelotrichaceae bacterium]|nr:Franean1_4349 family RiPP [Erysipelotrichaceae bacterium]
MSQDSVEKLLGRLITDDRFRTEAAASLEKLCRLEGYDLTEGELNMIARIDVQAFARVAVQLDPGLRRAGRAG